MSSPSLRAFLVHASMGSRASAGPRASPPRFPRAVIAMALALALGGGALAETSEACGRPGFIGLASSVTLAPDGGLRLHLTLTDAPIDPLPVLPAVFADGVLLETGGPIALSCGAGEDWEAEAAFTLAAHAVHWTLLPWPPVPPALLALGPEEAAARYATRLPPGLGPWSDVALLRPEGAPPRPRPAMAAARDDGAATAQLVDDAVTWWGDDDERARLARAATGTTLRFRLSYLAGRRGAGPVVATCLLDGRQIAAFAGAPTHDAVATAGRLLELVGEVTVPGPGWHRLQCLLLPDDPGERPSTWPRPLQAAYLWGDP